jgi:hypothetical protein
MKLWHRRQGVSRPATDDVVKLPHGVPSLVIAAASTLCIRMIGYRVELEFRHETEFFRNEDS